MKIGTTEARNPHSVDIDLMDSMQIVQLINEEDHKVAEGVKEALPQIARQRHTILLLPKRSFPTF